MLALFLSAAILQAATPDAVPTAAGLPSNLVSRPMWLRRPSAQDLARNFPRDAERRGIEGRAIVQCTVSEIGTLEKCAVVNEEPAGRGFGEATLRLSKLFLMRVTDAEDASVVGRSIKIPVAWRLPH